jgi:hypothetical protein
MVRRTGLIGLWYVLRFSSIINDTGLILTVYAILGPSQRVKDWYRRSHVVTREGDTSEHSSCAQELEARVPSAEPRRPDLEG